jgi:DNA-binding MarR family transcriptional regulator
MNERLTAHVERAAHAIGIYAESGLQALGLTHPETHVLAHLAGAEQASISELHHGFGHRRSTLTGVLDRLEGRGFVERLPHPSDRRATVVALTRRGRRAAGEAVVVLDRLEAAVTRAVPRGDIDSFRRVCAAIEGATKEVAT